MFRSKGKDDSKLRRKSITSPPGNSAVTGWLSKFSRSGKWQRRYFVLHGHYVKYYQPKTDADAKAGVLGEVKAAYDLYDLNKKKDIRKIAAMDGFEMLISFLHADTSQGAEPSKEFPKAGESFETVYQIKADTEEQADEWIAKIELWKHIERPTKEQATEMAAQEESALVEQHAQESEELAIRCEGFLERPLDGKRNKFQRRYFTSQAHHLLYYPNVDKFLPQGKVALDLAVLEGVRVLPMLGGRAELLLALGDGTGPLPLRCDTLEDAELWRKELAAAMVENEHRALEVATFFRDCEASVLPAVKLVRTAQGLGLSLEALRRGAHEAVVVDAFVPGTPGQEAADAGTVKVGDVLMSVNGVVVLKNEPERWVMGFEEALGHFKADELELVFARPMSADEAEQNLAAAKLQAIQRGRLQRRKATQANEPAEE